MKLIKSFFEIIDPTGYTIDDIYKSIELAGRTCYLSYDKITDNSAKKFVDMIIKRGHYSILENGTVYLYINSDDDKYQDLLIRYVDNPYSIAKRIIHDNKMEGPIESLYITTNYRVLLENNWLDDLKYLCTPTEFHEKRITVKFILPISISREFVRHKYICAAK